MTRAKNASSTAKPARTSFRQVEKMVLGASSTCFSMKEPPTTTYGTTESSTLVPLEDGTGSMHQCKTTTSTKSLGKQMPSSKSIRRNSVEGSPTKVLASSSRPQSPLPESIINDKNRIVKLEDDRLEESDFDENDYELVEEDIFFCQFSNIEKRLKEIHKLPIRVIHLGQDKPLFQVGERLYEGSKEKVMGTHLIFRQSEDKNLELLARSNKTLVLAPTNKIN